MASRNFVNAGYDPVTQGTPNDSQLLQMVQQIAPETDIGWVIIQEITPDVSAYPEYETFIWLKPSTSEVKYWNGTSWQLISSAPTIADGSITLDKLSTSGLSAGQFIRVNVEGNSFEAVNLADLFPAGSITFDKLESVADGDFLLAEGSTALEPTNFEAKWLELLLFAQVPIDNIWDTASAGQANQVPKLEATAGQLEFAWVDELIRDAKITPAKFKFPAGSALKIPQVQAGLSDFNYLNIEDIQGARPSVAIIEAQYAEDTDGQTISGATTATIELNAVASDLDDIVDLASNDFTIKEAGVYLIEASVIFDGEGEYQLQLYNVDTTTIVKHRSVTRTPQDEEGVISIWAVVEVTGNGNDTFRLRWSQTGGTTVMGNKTDFTGFGEIYHQVKIQRIGS